MKKFLLTLSEYNRIHQVARGVIEGLGTAERSCIFFAVFGAYILETRYKIPATAVAGNLAICISDEPKVAFFGRNEGGQIVADSDGFHMWVQTDTHIIDFMAPIFPESFAGTTGDTVIPRKMLQRPNATEAYDLDSLNAIGDFITLPSRELTHTLLEKFGKRPANSDLIHVAETWFGKPKGKQLATFAMINDLGEVTNLKLPANVATGSW
ncbi:DUF2026 family protein [Bombella apis]|uniref:DUF2026 family protein n=1 Tax=Bombella apis TaxID=1785988 RepID=A0ABR9MNQ3_9PROT|nr:DUF2026 family protein [Bombella apis]MBE1723487.1 DUF2026 family protein [Bombella apis]MBR9730266.1 DUF2026 family protein [Bombella apis]